MFRILVLDASTAILLAKVGLLREVTGRGEVWMAEGAYQEATVKDVDDSRLIRKLAEDGDLRRASPQTSWEGLAHDFRLGRGEAEAILLAQEKEALCGTDDGPAIRCLKVLGLPFTSAVALLVVMAAGGLVEGELAGELLSKLEHYGRYDPRIIEDALRRIRAAGAQKKRGER